MIRRLIHIVTIVLVILAVVASAREGAAQSTASGAVVVIPITGPIDLASPPFLARVLADAERDGAAAVLLHIDTPGGRLDAVLQMQDALLGTPVRTIAFVDRSAFSAGALVAIASQEIYMTPGAVMGAATPVDGLGETASEKIVSAVRKTFKTTAEVRERDPLVAEAMVDPNVTVPGLSERGDLLTLTTNEAVAAGYAEGVAATLPEALAAAGLADAPVVNASPSPAERVARFVTEPLIATLLLIGALVLIGADLLVEGVGFGAVGGLAFLGLFFWGHALAGLTGWEDIALVVLGLGLLLVELVILPGFGVAGALGIAALGGGLFMVMLSRDIQTPEGIRQAGVTVLVSLLASVVAVIAIASWLPRNQRLSRLVLQTSDAGSASARTTPERVPSWVRWAGGAALPPAPERRDVGGLFGSTGIARTDLRPSGQAVIDGHTVDVVTDGEYIPAGEPVEVIADEGWRTLVRRSD